MSMKFIDLDINNYGVLARVRSYNYNNTAECQGQLDTMMNVAS